MFGNERPFSWETTFSYQSIGFAFTLVWSALVFSTQGYLAPDGITQWSRLICFFVSISAFIAVMLLAPFIGEKYAHYGVLIYVWIPLACMVAGTLVIIISSFTSAVPLIYALLIIGAVLTGFGSGLLNIAWGIAFSTITTRKILGATAATFMFAGVICFSTISLPTYFVIALMLGCPVVSVAILRISRVSLTVPELFRKPVSISPYARKVFLSALVFGFVIGGMQHVLEVFYPQSVASSGMLRLVSSIVIFLALFFLSTSIRNFNSNTLYKVGVMLISVSIVLTMLIDRLLILTFFFILLGEYFIKIFIWTSLASLGSKQDVSPIFSFGMGWGLHHLGILAGQLALLIYDQLVPLTAFANQIPVYIALTLIVIIAGLFGLNDTTLHPVDSEAYRQQQRERFREVCKALTAEYGLSQREGDIVALLAQNMSLKKIQQSLVLSSGTVNTHIAHIYKKIGVHSRREIVSLFEQYCDVPAPAEDRDRLNGGGVGSAEASNKPEEH